MKKIIAYVVWLASGAVFANPPVYGPHLEGFDYPAPVQSFSFVAQRQPMQMAYLDYPAAKPQAPTMVLLTNQRPESVKDCWGPR